MNLLSIDTIFYIFVLIYTLLLLKISYTLTIYILICTFACVLWTLKDKSYKVNYNNGNHSNNNSVFLFIFNIISLLSIFYRSVVSSSLVQLSFKISD